VLWTRPSSLPGRVALLPKPEKPGEYEIRKVAYVLPSFGFVDKPKRSGESPDLGALI
jgi:hypothetical protein